MPPPIVLDLFLAASIGISLYPEDAQAPVELGRHILGFRVPTARMVPAAGQGALAIQVRSGDGSTDPRVYTVEPHRQPRRLQVDHVAAIVAGIRHAVIHEQPNALAPP